MGADGQYTVNQRPLAATNLNPCWTFTQLVPRTLHCASFPDHDNASALSDPWRSSQHESRRLYLLEADRSLRWQANHFSRRDTLTQSSTTRPRYTSYISLCHLSFFVCPHCPSSPRPVLLFSSPHPVLLIAEVFSLLLILVLPDPLFPFFFFFFSRFFCLPPACAVLFPQSRRAFVTHNSELIESKMEALSKPVTPSTALSMCKKIRTASMKWGPSKTKQANTQQNNAGQEVLQDKEYYERPLPTSSTYRGTVVDVDRHAASERQTNE